MFKLLIAIGILLNIILIIIVYREWIPEDDVGYYGDPFDIPGFEDKK